MHPWHGKTYEQLFGKENAQIRRTQCASIGEKNAQYGKPAYGGSGNGWSGWYKEWYFRSIMELSFMINYIEKNNLKWKTAEHKQYARSQDLSFHSNLLYCMFRQFVLCEKSGQ